MISIRGLSKSYGDLQVLRDISVDIEKGEVISVIGPSGCGKSTLIRCLNRLEEPQSGEVWIDGENILAPDADVPRLRQKMGMVFQSFNLFSHLTIIENIMLGPVELRKLDRQTAYDEGMKLLDTVGLAAKAFAYPDELSGGQRQRAAIARTLAMEPEIVLFDEPTSALDPRMVSEVEAVIKKLAGDGLTMMIVTHEMSFARKVSTRVFYMDEKGIYEDGPPEQIFEAPQRPKTREFIFKVHSWTQEIHRAEFDAYAFWGGIGDFLHKQFLPEKRIHDTQLVSEEVVYQLLFAQLGEDIRPLHFRLQYSEREDTVEMTVTSDQIRSDLPDAPECELSMRIIRGYAREFRCVDGELTVLL